MIRIIMLCALGFCFQLSAMKENYLSPVHIEAHFTKMLDESNGLLAAAEQKSNDSILDGWPTLLANAYQLEMALERNFIKDEELEKNISTGIDKIHAAWKAHEATEKKDSGLNELK